MRHHDRSAAPIASSIDLLRRQLGLGATSALVRLSVEWETLAGIDAAKNSEIIDLRSGVLTVNAYDPATAEILNWSKQRILEGARLACPQESISEVSIRVRRRPQ